MAVVPVPRTEIAKSIHFHKNCDVVWVLVKFHKNRSFQEFCTSGAFAELQVRSARISGRLGGACGGFVLLCLRMTIFYNEYSESGWLYNRPALHLLFL